MAGNDRVDEIVGQLAQRMADQAHEHFTNYIHDVGLDSPIEKLMVAGLLFALEHNDHWGGHGTGSRWLFHVMPHGSFESLRPEFSSHSGIHIHCQMPVGKYKADFFVDFLAYGGKRVFGVIECDGHDYHERTKSQAQHDKARDRYFQSLGITVLRYTGSEIYKDPLKCALDALNILDGLSDPRPR